MIDEEEEVENHERDCNLDLYRESFQQFCASQSGAACSDQRISVTKSNTLVRN